MTDRRRIEPFELDPATAGPARIELVEETEPGHPLPVVPEPPAPRRRPWLRLLLGAGGAALAALLGLEAYDYVASLFERSAILGAVFAALFALVGAGALGVALRELLSLRRLARIDTLRLEGARLMGTEVHGRAEGLIARIEGLYADRPAVRERAERFRREASDALGDGEQLQLFARTVLQPLDREAYRLVRNGARDIGALTAFSPFGLLDSAIVLARTLTMLRQIATLYGVRPTAATTWQLLRRAVRNIVIAGVGELVSDAAVETAGAGLLGMLSARAGQGAVNGLLAARLGLSAMQVCRPLPFAAGELPSLKQLRAEVLGVAQR